ncbi:hypothetical protein BUALT_Bualt06G0004700 [Buddleja alternifolia]|uniref:AP2/ERF domain-containing protein n=1 Tax=Buddleja alternifolia TaxID=168488 RepID=A0AAV6XMF8_9LAMI|nr:hypothetical protein BUALT_Bualt06G0004700 [Buddleja alternifolia]
MGSMNNWLGFSLSPQEDHHSQSSVSHFANFNSDEISATQSESCFDLTSTDSTIPSLNLNPPPFALLQAFNTNTAHAHHHQDWNMKDVTMNNFSCSSSNNLDNQERPKLENFLGVGKFSHSFTDHHHHHQEHKNLQHIYQNNIGHDNHNSYNIYQENDEAISHETNATAGHVESMNGNNSTIGLSMIKNWLRNNPAPPQAEENKVDNEAVAPPVAGAQSLSLSMSTGSQISSPNLPIPNGNNSVESSTTCAIDSVPRKSADTFGQRTSIYRGVTRHRWTGRYEAHLWDNSCRREGQTRKGKQGGYDKEDKAARSYDLAALKYWGTTTTTNFPISNYEKEIEEMKHMTRLEFIASLRRKSSGFSRGASIYRGVTRHHQHGRWQARIGRVAGNKDLYLGTFSTQEEAAEAYDIAAIKFRGLSAVTNFEINRYDVKTILESATLPIGAAAKRLKDAENAEMALKMQRADEVNLIEHGHINGWPSSIAFQQQSQPLIMYPYNQRLWCKQEQDPDNSFNSINHQIQQLGNTQNFVQPSVLHNLMSLDSCSMQNGPGSNSVVYGNNGNGSFVDVQDEEKPVGYEGMYGLTDARNLYYQQQPQQSSSCDYNWIPTAVPAPGARNFTVWNNT